MASRLQGNARRPSMQLSLPRPDETIDVGPDALVRLSESKIQRIPALYPFEVLVLCNVFSGMVSDLFEFRRVQH